VRSRPWDRDVVIGELRDQLWLHVSPAATRHDTTLQAAALLQLPYADVERLGTLHFVLDPAVSALLDDGPALLRRLASDTRPVTEVGVDRVRGPVDWPATARRRALDRTPVVVTHPRHRDADIQPNRTLALVLHAVADASVGLGFSAPGRPGALAFQVAAAGRRAAALAAHRALRDVVPAPPTPRDLAALRAPRVRRRHTDLLAAWDCYDRLVRRIDAHAVRSAVEQRGFTAAGDGALFELLVLFRLRAALAGGGWTTDRARVFGGALRFSAVRGADKVTVWFQGVPAELRRTSAYTGAQRVHSLPGARDLQPDLVLSLQRPGRPVRRLVIEAKTTEGRQPVQRLARRALGDLLAYRSAYAIHLDGQAVWGLGVVWGSGLGAAPGHEVGLCTPDRLADALAAFVVDIR
jgi:hypothetical protein